MLHYHNGVPYVPESFYNPDEAVVVAWMKPDARFVKYIKAVDQ